VGALDLGNRNRRPYQLLELILAVGALKFVQGHGSLSSAIHL
jgi:hypothetical protein